MTDYEILVGDPGNPERWEVSGDDIVLEQLDARGCRRVTVYKSHETDEEPVTKAELTAGPDHVLGYEVVEE